MTAIPARGEAASDFDSFDPALAADPYPVLRRIRDAGPIGWSRAEAAWVLPRRAEVAAVMADRRFGVAEVADTIARLGAASGRDFADLCALFRVVLFLRNPPGHAAERRFLARVLGIWPLASYAPLIEEIAADLLAPARAEGGLDLVTGYADLLPPRVMGRLFGLADAAALELVELAADLTQVFDRGRSLSFYAAANAKAARARAMMADVVRERRRRPGGDALSHMLALNDAEFGLDDLDIATRAFFLFLAGVETTSALIGGALRGLLMHPGEMARLRSGEITPAAAFEELARWTSPVQQASRHALEAVEVAGQPIRAGDRLVLLVGSANHDPAAWPDPDRLLLGRPGPASLTFGTGLHHCIGMGLARLETCIAVAQLLALPPLRPVGPEAEWLPHRTQRRLRRLPVAFA